MARTVTPAPGMEPGANQEGDEMINMNALADRIHQVAGHGPDELFRIISGEFPGVTVGAIRDRGEICGGTCSCGS
jgi:hypothetical protein